jgi:hypothetical protein
VRIQYIVDPLNQILVRVRTPGPSQDRRHLSQLKKFTSTGPYKELVKQVAIASLKVFWNFKLSYVLVPFSVPVFVDISNSDSGNDRFSGSGQRTERKRNFN